MVALSRPRFLNYDSRGCMRSPWEPSVVVVGGGADGEINAEATDITPPPHTPPPPFLDGRGSSLPCTPFVVTLRNGDRIQTGRCPLIWSVKLASPISRIRRPFILLSRNPFNKGVGGSEVSHFWAIIPFLTADHTDPSPPPTLNASIAV